MKSFILALSIVAGSLLMPSGVAQADSFSTGPHRFTRGHVIRKIRHRRHLRSKKRLAALRRARCARPTRAQIAHAPGTPELDPGAAGAGFVLLVGGALVLSERRRRTAREALP
ncbi:MAG: hypothetical protein MJD61_12865 [Proteobacteria bacterium]|nr:hypothetical protein [Pseudomonadota bacterium]